MAEYYVATTGDDLNPGSAALPWLTIQNALDNVLDLDTIWVLDGVYAGAGNRDLRFGGKQVTLRSLLGYQNCIIDAGGTDIDPHRHFIFDGGEPVPTLIQGFTLVGGYEAGGSSILCTDDGEVVPTESSFTIRECYLYGNEDSTGEATILIANIDAGINIVNMYDCIIEDNIGNGITNVTGIVTVRDSEFSRNNSSVTAGAISSSNDQALLVERSSFIDNIGTGTGAILLSGGGNIRECLFANNSGENNPISFGGAIFINYACAAITTIINSLFYENEALAEDPLSGGGAVSVGFEAATVTLTNCTMTKNHGYQGGAIFTYGCESSDVLVQNCIIWDNESDYGHEVYILEDCQGV